MTDEIQQETPAEKTYTQAEFDKEISGLKAKVDELLGEKKTAAAKAKEAQEAAERERLEKAKAVSDYESLFKDSESKRAAIEARARELEESITRGKIESAARSMAVEIADTAHDADYLSEVMARRLKTGENGELMVLDKNGNPTVSTVDDLKKEIMTSASFAKFLKGSGATGGWATGNKGGGAAKTADRKTFDNMNQTQRHDFIKSGGKITD